MCELEGKVDYHQGLGMSGTPANGGCAPPTLILFSPLVISPQVFRNRYRELLKLRIPVSSRDFQVTLAGSGEEALDLYRRDPFPLVITDVVMGKMSGLDLLQEVKAIDPETVVVIMTSHASMESAIRAHW